MKKLTNRQKHKILEVLLETLDVAVEDAVGADDNDDDEQLAQLADELVDALYNAAASVLGVPNGGSK